MFGLEPTRWRTELDITGLLRPTCVLEFLTSHELFCAIDQEVMNDEVCCKPLVIATVKIDQRPQRS